MSILTRDEATELWITANDNSCCSCHQHPPCDFCVDGFGLWLEEFLSVVYGYDDADVPMETAASAYDRAMKIIK